MRPGHIRSLAFGATAALVLGATSGGTGASSPKAVEPKPMPTDARTDVRLEPVPYRELTGWQVDDHAAALKAFLKSCDRLLAAVKGGAFTGKAAPSPALLVACEDAAKLAPRKLKAAAARTFFEASFTPHRVVHPGTPGLLTAYYEPLIDGSRTPTDRFKTPIYRRPPDLVNLVDDAMRGAVGSTLTHARQTPAGLVAFATRAEIEEGALAGQGLELAYVADPVEAFFLQIQGSGQIRLADGSTFRVAYAGKNGHPYSSIGRHLVETGLFPADKMSMDSLASWLRADPARGRKVMWHNASYVFFRELTGEQAKSTIGVNEIPLTAGRSLAVDAGVHVIGAPIYVSASELGHIVPGGFHRLMIAQDVGSAIKGPERGDIFMGSGAAAGRAASITRHPGRFFVLVPRGPEIAVPAGAAP